MQINATKDLSSASERKASCSSSDKSFERVPSSPTQDYSNDKVTFTFGGVNTQKPQL